MRLIVSATPVPPHPMALDEGVAWSSAVVGSNVGLGATPSQAPADLFAALAAFTEDQWLYAITIEGMAGLVVEHFRAHEACSELFVRDILVLRTDAGLDIASLNGRRAKSSIALPDGDPSPARGTLRFHRADNQEEADLIRTPSVTRRLQAATTTLLSDDYGNPSSDPQCCYISDDEEPSFADSRPFSERQSQTA